MNVAGTAEDQDDLESLSVRCIRAAWKSTLQAIGRAPFAGRLHYRQLLDREPFAR